MHNGTGSILVRAVEVTVTVDCPVNPSVRVDPHFGARRVRRFVDHWRLVSLGRPERLVPGCWMAGSFERQSCDRRRRLK